MKYFSVILISIAVILIIYNSTLIDGKAPFKGDSMVAIIGIVAALCAILLLVIFKMSKKVKQKIENP